MTLLVSVSCVLLILALRESALRGWGPPILRLIFQEMLPPGGLYAKRVFSTIDLAIPGQTKSIEFEHSYVGDYELGVTSARRLPMPLPRNGLGTMLTVRAVTSSALLKEWSAGDQPVPWWTEDASGFAVVRYNVPRDVPRTRAITFLVTVIDGSTFFERAYGNAFLYIGKASEK